MDRRQFLAALAGTGGAGGLAGCVDRLAARSAESSTPSPVSTTQEDPLPDDADPTRLAQRGVPPTICQDEVSEDPGIYAITNPAFGDDWRDLSVSDRYRPAGVRDPNGITADHTVVGLTDGDVARAYPLGILWYHEIVNVDGRAGPTADPVMVTYCPLCASGLVASRVVDGTATEFLVSGLLWKAPRVQSGAAEAEGEVFSAESTGGETDSIRNNGNLVMYDRGTESYWSQILATAICGPMEGTELDVVPSTVTTWDEWREVHPDTEALLPPPHSGTVEPGK